jgi:hypothetical protein
VAPVTPDRPKKADVTTASFTALESLRTRVAGIFLFWPLLAQIRFDEMVRQAGYPGSKMVPAISAMLGLLVLKLVDKERRSHITDFNFDEAMGLFAGLNILPKTTFATDYSYRTDRDYQQGLLASWVSKLLPLLDPEPEAFSLDFHSIPHRGEDSVLENHYVPMRGKAVPSVLTFFAQATKSRLLCYSSAEVLREDQPKQLMRFVEFCREVLGQDPLWVYFDSKFTTYAELNRLNARETTSFITIRRRGVDILRRLEKQSADQWKRTYIDTPKRRHRNIRYLEESITLKDYNGSVRQIAVTGLGREAATLFLTNNKDETARQIITRYTSRNGIEDSLGTSVNFFHLDCLASDVRLNVDFDAALTVLANGCYRWLSTRLAGFETAKAKQLYRRFVQTAGTVSVRDDEIHVCFDKRSHNPILRHAALDADAPPIPWAGGKRLRFSYAGS